MSVQRSSFLRKLLITFFSLLKKELHSSDFKSVLQKLWNKANKEAICFRTFLEKCLRWCLFLEKLQASACNLNTNQLQCSNLQKVFSKLWNNNKKRVIFQKCIRWNHFRKNYRRLWIFFEKQIILLLSFQRQPPDMFYAKRCF